MAVKTQPDGYHTVTPYLLVEDLTSEEISARAAEYYSSK